jgi:RAP1 GTPase activating protein 1
MSLEKKIKKHLKSIMATYKLTVCPNANVVEDILRLEQQHPHGGPRNTKVSVIYSKANQTHPEEMFKNSTASDRLWEFMGVLATRIKLDSWQDYRGDMGKQGESYYTKWNDFELMFHVSTMLNSDQHRQLIGNDSQAIIFQEDTPVEHSNLDYLGIVPQIFHVVQPVETPEGTRYKVAHLVRQHIRSFEPEAPAEELFDGPTLRDYLLTKGIIFHLYNVLTCIQL